jgi:hypothetical protein
VTDIAIPATARGAVFLQSGSLFLSVYLSTIYNNQNQVQFVYVCVEEKRIRKIDRWRIQTALLALKEIRALRMSLSPCQKQSNEDRNKGPKTPGYNGLV